jgi:hypothetical protein
VDHSASEHPPINLGSAFMCRPNRASEPKSACRRAYPCYPIDAANADWGPMVSEVAIMDSSALIAGTGHSALRSRTQ